MVNRCPFKAITADRNRHGSPNDMANTSQEIFDANLIGLSVEEVYNLIRLAGLKTNLIVNKETGIIEAAKLARIMVLMPDYLTVEYNDKRIVVSVSRG
jgi:hypothetical protein